MKGLFLLILLSIFFIGSCSLKKKEVKIISKSKCDKLAFKIKNSKPDDNKYKITGIIRGKGLLYAIFRGYINSNSKISFYTPFGKKIYSIDSIDNRTFCIKSEKNLVCVDKKDFYKVFLKLDIPYSLKEFILGKYNLENINDYFCKDDTIIFKGEKQIYIYSIDGKLKNIKFNKFSIKYNWKNSKEYPTLIEIYKNGKYKLKLKIKSLKKVK